MFNLIRFYSTCFVIAHPKGVKYRVCSGAEFSPFQIEMNGRGVLGRGFMLLGSGVLKLGDNMMMAPNVLIITADHMVNRGKHEDGEKVGDVSIGDNVWIGAKVTILKGVTVGDNVTIGAGSVVTKNIPSNCVIAGNPARIIKSWS